VDQRVGDWKLTLEGCRVGGTDERHSTDLKKVVRVTRASNMAGTSGLWCGCRASTASRKTMKMRRGM
jgi:hypothetical protein